MGQAAIYNDGGLNYGTRTLTITDSLGANSNTYICENVTLTRPVTRIEQFDELGGPSKAAGVGKWVEGTATVQLATTGLRIPVSGDLFSTTFNAAIGAENFIVHQVSQPEGQNDPRKVNLEFRKKVN